MTTHITARKKQLDRQVDLSPRVTARSYTPTPRRSRVKTQPPTTPEQESAFRAELARLIATELQNPKGYTPAEAQLAELQDQQYTDEIRNAQQEKQLTDVLQYAGQNGQSLFLKLAQKMARKDLDILIALLTSVDPKLGKPLSGRQIAATLQLQWQTYHAREKGFKNRNPVAWRICQTHRTSMKRAYQEDKKNPLSLAKQTRGQSLEDTTADRSPP